MLLCAPYFSTVVLAADAILNAGTDDQQGKLLPGIASGETIATLAFTEPNGKWDATGIDDGRQGLGRQLHARRHQDVRARRPHRRPDRGGGPLEGTSGEDGISFFTVDGDAAGLTRTAAVDDGPDPQAGQARVLRRAGDARSATPGQAGPRCSKTLDQAAVALAERDGRRRAEGARHVGRVRQGARAVRPPDRVVPGHQAQVRRHAARGRVGQVGRVLRRPGRPPRTTTSCRWRRAWPRPTAPTPTSTPPPRTSRSTAASASPGSTTPTSTSSGRRAPRSSSATPTYHRELLAQRIGI